MTMVVSDKRSALGLTVLGILAGEPMHAYRIQKLIKDYGKDRVVNVRQRASIYQTIERLVKLELIRVDGVDKAEGRPERTVYAITEAGLTTTRSWIKQTLADSGHEYPEFPVGLSFLMMLTPAEALAELETRLAGVEGQLAELAPLLDGSSGVHRLFLVEEEYRRALLNTERSWLRELTGELRSGALDWSAEWVRRMAEEFDTRQERETT